jgi:hypothetical protein
LLKCIRAPERPYRSNSWRRANASSHSSAANIPQSSARAVPFARTLPIRERPQSLSEGQDSGSVATLM